ncbi:MAG: hypothetical protein KY445_12275 [Armatimonadetes bacterium]|nr:hypothetical protein [Armatimonadota bacterium]
MMNLSKRRWAPIALLLGGVAAPLLSISGCGGGGNGRTIPPPVVLGTPTPAPTPTVTPTPTPGPTPFPPGTTFEPNYRASIDAPRRWASFPITIHFVQDANLTPARRTLAITGFNQWVEATDTRVKYTIVNDANQADITVTFFTFMQGGTTLGQAIVAFDPQTSLIQNVRMELGITGDNTEDINTAAHELGHSLGIIGSTNDLSHSPNRADLMFTAGNTPRATGGCACVTTADRNTLYTIYNGQFPQRPNTARRPEPLGPLETIIVRQSRNRVCSFHHH